MTSDEWPKRFDGWASIPMDLIADDDVIVAEVVDNDDKIVGYECFHREHSNAEYEVVDDA